MWSIIPLLVTLNLVLIEENGHKAKLPAQLTYHKEFPYLFFTYLDTVEVYIIDRIDKDKNSTIIKVSSEYYQGWIRITLHNTGNYKNTTGSVFFYRYCKYCEDRFIDRKFRVDSEQCYLLAKKLRKRNKVNPG